MKLTRQAFLRHAGSLAVVACAGVAAPAFAADAAVKLVFADVNTKDSPVGKSVARLAELVKQRTNGSVTIDYFERSQLGNETELVNKVKNGSVDMADISTAVLSSFVPDVGIVTLPYLLESRHHGEKVLHSDMAADWAKQFQEKHHISLLGYFAGSDRDLYTRKPVNALKDFAGLKIRVVESQVYVSFIKALGGLPTPIPASEIYSALQTGVVDGTDVGSATYVTQKIYEQAPDVAKLDWLYGFQGILVSDRAMKRLSPAQRDALLASIKDAEKFSIETYDAFDKSIYTELAAQKKVTVTTPDLREFRKAVQVAYDNEWNAKYGKDKIERIRAMAK
ncbi:MAG TPA: TRAP transporter substrate-binding protein [Ramlibacter sp.]